MLRFKACTLPKGSWYGDYQILLNITSNWDIEAGLDMKGKASNSLPTDMMQVYELPAEEFMDLMNQYIDYRRFILVRSLVRRAYFKKAFDDNMQEILIKRKEDEHQAICNATDIPNLFNLDLDQMEEDKDNGVEQKEISDSDIHMSQSLQRFRRYIKRGLVDKSYDPMSLKNRVELVDRGYAQLTDAETDHQKDLSELN